MEDIEFSYWIIEYTSCESNERWIVAITPIDWTEYDIRSNIRIGGCGDDIAEINSIYKTHKQDYSFDFT